MSKTSLVPTAIGRDVPATRAWFSKAVAIRAILTEATPALAQPLQDFVALAKNGPSSTGALGPEAAGRAATDQPVVPPIAVAASEPSP